MDISIFEGIGISSIEAKVFVVILELGESKAGKIIEKSGLQSSSVYHALHGLLAKGLLSYIKKSEVKYYTAADPEVIVDYIDGKKKEYLKMLPILKAKQNKTDKNGVEFFKSYRGIRTILWEMIKDAKKGDEYLTFSIDDPAQYELAREKVFRSIKTLMKEKKLGVRGIFSEHVRYRPTSSSLMKKRYLDMPLPPNTSILNGMVAVISWGDEPSGILIRSKEIADKYRDFFEAMWKIAKK